MRIDHFDAGGAEAIDLGFAVKNEKLAGFQSAFEIAAVKKFARERTGVVLDEKMIDGIAATHAANSLTAGDADFEREEIVGANISNLRKMKAVFVSERQVTKEIFESVDATFGKEFGTLRAYSFDHLDIGLQAIGHKGSYSRDVVASTKIGWWSASDYRVL